MGPPKVKDSIVLTQYVIGNFDLLLYGFIPCRIQASPFVKEQLIIPNFQVFSHRGFCAKVYSVVKSEYQVIMTMEFDFKDPSIIFGLTIAEVSNKLVQENVTSGEIFDAVADISQPDPAKTYVILRDLQREEPDFLIHPGLMRFWETSKMMLPLIINPHSDLMLNILATPRISFNGTVELINEEMPKIHETLGKVGMLLQIHTGQLLSKAEIARFSRLTIK